MWKLCWYIDYIRQNNKVNVYPSLVNVYPSLVDIAIKWHSHKITEWMSNLDMHNYDAEKIITATETRIHSMNKNSTL